MASDAPKITFARYEPMVMDYERRLAIVREVLDDFAPNSYRIDGPDYRSGFKAFEIIPKNPKAASVFFEATTDDECFHVEGFVFRIEDGNEEGLRAMIDAVGKGNFRSEHWYGDMRRGSLKIGERWKSILYWGWPILPIPFLKRTKTYEPYK